MIMDPTQVAGVVDVREINFAVVNFYDGEA